MLRTELSLYEPLYTLKEVDQNIWIVDGDLIQMDMKIFKLPFQTRMTVIKLMMANFGFILLLRQTRNSLLNWTLWAESLT